MQNHFESQSYGLPRSKKPSNEEITQTLLQHINRLYEKRHVPQSQQWCTLPEIPSGSELLDQMADQSTLPPNVIDGPWESKEAYIGAHYQLLREDGLAPLRNALATFKSSPFMVDDRFLCIYTHVRHTLLPSRTLLTVFQVHIVGYTLASQGFAARVEFSYERARKRIRWRQSDRLKQGTILVMSTHRDMFKRICKVVVVAARPLEGLEQNPPQVDLYWAGPGDAEIDPQESWIMIEARSGYWEASRHMLVVSYATVHAHIC